MQTVLITGASSGIGLELARLFAKDGYVVVLVARNTEKLEEIAKELPRLGAADAIALPADLAEPGAAEQLWAQIDKRNLEIDVLVNNAGFGLFGEFTDTDLQKELAMVQLNIVALTELTKLALQQMKQQNRGRILNVASTAAFQPGPLMAVYYASKAYVLSFSEALSEELRQSPITVTVLCPGPTATGFEEKADLGKSNLFSSQKLMSATKVAQAAYAGMQAGKTIILPGFRNKIGVFLVRLTPRRVVRRVVHYVQRPKEQSG